MTGPGRDDEDADCATSGMSELGAGTLGHASLVATICWSACT